MDKNSIVEKSNEALLKYVCDLARLLGEIHRRELTQLRNSLTNWRTKKRIGIEGKINDYEIFSVNGIDSKRFDALTKHYEIKGHIITDESNGLVLFVADKKHNEMLLKLEKDVADGKIDIEEIYQEYLSKEQNKNQEIEDIPDIKEVIDDIENEELDIKNNEPDIEIQMTNEESKEFSQNDNVFDANSDFEGLDENKYMEEFPSSFSDNIVESNQTEYPDNDQISKNDIYPDIVPDDYEEYSTIIDDSINHTENTNPDMEKSIEYSDVIDSNAEFSADQSHNRTQIEDVYEQEIYDVQSEDTPDLDDHELEHNESSTFSKTENIDLYDASTVQDTAEENQSIINQGYYNKQDIEESSAVDSNPGTLNENISSASKSENNISDSFLDKDESDIINSNSDYETNRDNMESPSLSYNAEREKRERDAIYEKQKERKAAQENVNTWETGTGAALFTAYSGKSDEFIEQPDKKQSGVDYTNIDYESKENKSDSSKILHEYDAIRNNGLYGYQKQESQVQKNIGSPVSNNAGTEYNALSTDNLAKEKQQKPYLAPENNQNNTFSINRMELINRYSAAVDKNVFLMTGKMMAVSVETDFRESMEGKGKREFSGVSAYINKTGYSSMAKDIENTCYRKLNKQLLTPGNQYTGVNQLLAANKFGQLNFGTIKDSRASMESLYLNLQNAGLASKRDGIWDITKFERLYKRAQKKGDYSELARAFRLSNNHQYDWKTIFDGYHDIMKRMKFHREGESNKKQTSRSLRSMIRHKLAQDTDFLNGYLQSKQTAKSVRSTYRAGKLATVFLGKSIWRGARFVSNRKVFENTKFSKSVKYVDKKINDRKVKKSEKVSERQKAKQDKIEQKNKRKNDRKDARLQKWDRKAPKILKSNGVIGKRVRAISSKTKTITKRVSSIVKKLNPLKIVGKVNVVSAFIKKWALIIGAGALIILSVILVIFILLTSIISFFSSDNKKKPEDIYASSMGKNYQKLQEAEIKWASKLKNETDKISLADYNVKYGPRYVSPEVYVPSEAVAKAAWEQYNVTWVPYGNTGYFTANPFGNFELDENVSLKKIQSFDGGVEMDYETKDGSPRTSNIKEIMCMSDIYFLFSTETKDTHDTDSDPSVSVNSKRSGLTYAASDEKVTSEDKKLTSGVIWDYCQNLFNVSHQEIIDLTYVVLPTILTKNALIEENVNINEVNMDAVTFCPKGDEGGCAYYDDFYYINGVLSIKDKNGVFHPVSSKVVPADRNNRMLEEGESDVCYASEPRSLKESLEKHPECWHVSKNETARYEICDANIYSANGSEELKDLVDGGTIVFYNWMGSSLTIVTEEVVDHSFHLVSEEVKEIKDPITGKIIRPGEEEDSHYDDVVVEMTYYFSNICHGEHHGRFCGGHLKADITGIIYGFTDKQIAAENKNDIIGKVGKNEYAHQDVSKFTIIDASKMYQSEDLFDVDSCVVHSSERKAWEGWTQQNMELALLKYNMDWEELYGITVSSSLGGHSLSVKEQLEILNAIKMNYPDLSEERLNVIAEGLSWVGNIGYSQAHHVCPLTGPCSKNPNITCGLSDCSGFVSHLWQNRLGGINTTATFYRHPLMTGIFNWDTTKPGDILVHYGGKIADNTDDHALLYLGTFEYDGITQAWTIDCSTVNGVGNVFLRHRDYYGNCYVVSPAP